MVVEGILEAAPPRSPDTPRVRIGSEVMVTAHMLAGRSRVTVTADASGRVVIVVEREGARTDTLTWELFGES